ncbi:MAG: hypothetical protein JSV22_00370 [Bacteroidales bacterium]|nr:MAG: hypothetical protein JSV22_00370 [Bacteroidales bacterium]
MGPQIKSVQQHLLNIVQDLIPDKYSLVFELSELLGLSSDSVYRRLRGETLLTIEEVQQICTKFNISFDSICGSDDLTTVAFKFHRIRGENDFKEHLISIRNDLKVLQTKEDVHVTYAAIDMPFFHNFRFPVINTFKSFYWLKSVSNYPAYQPLKFSCKFINEELNNLGMEIYKIYCSLPSTEIWTDLIHNSILKQISYYWDSGEFSSKDDALQLCDEVEQQFALIRQMAEKCSKIPDEEQTVKKKDNFEVYFSEIQVATHCIQVRVDNFKTVYLSNQTFNKLVTSNVSFNEETDRWLNNIIKKSILISGVGEKQRYKFFKSVFDKISALKDKIANY